MNIFCEILKHILYWQNIKLNIIYDHHLWLASTIRKFVLFIFLILFIYDLLSLFLLCILRLQPLLHLIPRPLNRLLLNWHMDWHMDRCRSRRRRRMRSRSLCQNSYYLQVSVCISPGCARPAIDNVVAPHHSIHCRLAGFLV